MFMNFLFLPCFVISYFYDMLPWFFFRLSHFGGHDCPAKRSQRKMGLFGSCEVSTLQHCRKLAVDFQNEAHLSLFPGSGNTI